MRVGICELADEKEKFTNDLLKKIVGKVAKIKPFDEFFDERKILPPISLPKKEKNKSQFYENILKEYGVDVLIVMNYEQENVSFLDYGGSFLNCKNGSIIEVEFIYYKPKPNEYVVKQASKVIVHEFGHLAGLTHEDGLKEKDVMALYGSSFSKKHVKILKEQLKQKFS